MNRQTVFILLICLTAHARLMAQGDTVWLQPALITAERTELFAAGIKAEKTDTLTARLFQGEPVSRIPLSPLLAIKDYGSGGIATVSIRGMEARHTAFIWQGIPVGSPSLGLADLSLIPLHENSQLYLYAGNVSTLYSCGSSGGALVIRQQPGYRSGLSAGIKAGTGSFGRKDASVNLSLSGNRIAYQSSAMFHSAVNDFPFINTTLFPPSRQNQTHAAVNCFSLVQSAGFKPNPKTELTFSSWYQFANRQIPPLMTQFFSRAAIRDSALRLTASFNYFAKSFVFQFKSAWLKDHQRYDDSLFRIHTEYITQTIFNEGAFTIPAGRSVASRLSVVYAHTRFDIDEYNGRPHFDDWSVMNSWRWEKNKIRLSASGKWMNRNGVTMPLTFSGGASWQLKKQLSLRCQLVRSCQLPSGNDLYWLPGGNPDLKPEKSFTGESGIDWKPFPQFESSVTFYQTRTHDWIQWIPVSGGLYAPHNVKKVNTQGIESAVRFPVLKNTVVLCIDARYVYTRSVNSDTKQSLADDLLNKQLIYIPQHSYSLSGKFGYKKMELFIHHAYTGLRYTTSDHSFYLPAHHHTTVALYYSITFKSVSLHPYMRVGNLFDNAYQSIAYRPMPGRNFQTGIKLNFNHKHKNYELND